MMIFNPPPRWPEPPYPGWTPPEGWTPNPDWGPVPEGWELWIDDRNKRRKIGSSGRAGTFSLLNSEKVPTVGALGKPRIAEYPILPIKPGRYRSRPISPDTNGFPPAPAPAITSSRWRKLFTIVAPVTGIVIAAIVISVFLLIANYAT